MSINILGSGYVGLTLGIFAANQGMKVNMVDIDDSKIKKLKSGISPVHEIGIQEALDFAINSRNIQFSTKLKDESSIWIIAISYFPGRPKDFINSITEINFSKDITPVIMIRTTIPSGFINDHIIPSLEKHFNGKIDKNFHVVSAPERSLSGDAINELRDLPQILGGTEESTLAAAKVFKTIGIETIKLEGYESAELVKSFTNFSRLVQFNLSNYLGVLCSIYNVNEKELLHAIKYEYPRMNFLSISGPGVGGFCLPKDSLVMHDSLIENTKLKSNHDRITNYPLIQYELNEDIIKYNAKKIESFLSNNSKVLALGIAFKGEPHTDDTRDSVGLKMINYLKENGKSIHVFDLSVSKNKIHSLGHDFVKPRGLKNFDAILFLNNDSRYSDLIKRLAIKESIIKKFVVYDPWKIFLKYDQRIIEKGNLIK